MYQRTGVLPVSERPDFDAESGGFLDVEETEEGTCSMCKCVRVRLGEQEGRWGPTPSFMLSIAIPAAADWPTKWLLIPRDADHVSG